MWGCYKAQDIREGEEEEVVRSHSIGRLLPVTMGRERELRKDGGGWHCQWKDIVGWEGGNAGG
jgi:hypothetical protein